MIGRLGELIVGMIFRAELGSAYLVLVRLLADIFIGFAKREWR